MSSGNEWRGDSALPPGIGRAMVSSLFFKEGTLAWAYLLHLAGSVTCWYMTGDPALLWIAAALSLVTVARIVQFRAFRRHDAKALAPSELRRWERLYIIGSCAASASVSAQAAYVILFHINSPAFAFSLTLVCANMVGVVGRGFGSRANIDILVLSGVLPVALASLYVGFTNAPVWTFMIALLIVPFGGQARTLARFVHKLLLTSLFEHHKLGLKSRSFDIAVNYMPNGLVLVGEDGGIILANQRAAELQGSSSSRELVGTPFVDFMRGKDGGLGNSEKRQVKEFMNGRRRTLEIETDDGRWIEFMMSELEVEGNDALSSWDEVPHRVVIVEDITERVRHQKHVEFVARHDNLTGLPNRHHMQTLVGEHMDGLPPDARVAICVFDVDRFKIINDTLGHHVGDRVIAGVGERLKEIAFPRVAACRWGGDEFVVFLADIADDAEVRAVFDELFERLCSTFVIEGENVEVNCSGGVAVRRVGEFDLALDIAKADMALYKVKRRSARWTFFTEDMESEYDRVLRIKQDLIEAINTSALEIIYQPIYAVATNQVVSAEALCRWKHAEAGFISPTEFIPLAEEIGFIGKLTEYVLKTACRDATTWDNAVGISVNFSALDLWRDDILDLIQETLAETGLDPSRLTIELTETVFVRDHARTSSVLQSIRDLGVKTAIDDFGTLYSSLSYLHKLPMDRVKIDRSFIADITDDPKTQKLFKGVVGLSKEMEYEVVVEGVESGDQLRLVMAAGGVDMVQGFAMSRALNPFEIVDEIENKKRQRLETRYDVRVLGPDMFSLMDARARAKKA